MQRLTLLIALSCCLVKANAVEVVVQSAHTAAITDLTYIKQGSLLVSSSEDGTARIWDAKSGRLLRLIEAHAGGVSALAISSDDQEIVTVGKDGYAKVWSLESGALIRQNSFGDSVTSVSCSPNGPECVVATGSRVVLLPLNPAQQAHSLGEFNPIAVRYLPDGKHIAVSCRRSPGLRLIESVSGQTTAQRNTLLPLSHLRTSSSAIYGTTNYDVLSFSVASGLNEAASAKSANAINGFDLDGSEQVYAAVNGQSIPRWKGGMLTVSSPLILQSGVYTAVALNASDGGIAFGDAGGSLYIVDGTTGKIAHQIVGHTDLIYQTAFRADGSLLITGGQGPMTRVWTLGDEEQTLSLPGEVLDIRAATWIKNHTLLITSAPMQITIWDVSHRHALQHIATKDIDGWPLVCRELGVCAWTEGNTINVKNFLSDEPVQMFSIDQDVALDLDISPDGKYLAAAVNRSVVRLWSLVTQTELTPLQLEVPKSIETASPYFAQSWQHATKFYFPSIGMASIVRFTAEGHRLAAANEVGIHIWNVDQPGLPQMLRGYSGHISFLDFENHDVQLYSGGDDGTIRMWTPGSSSDSKICAHTRLVPAGMSLSKDGIIGAISLPDGEVELWNLRDSGQLVTIDFPGSGGWLVHTPEGLFEASEDAWKDADFRFESQTTNVAPIEGYFQNYFEPGLLSDLLADEVEPHPADPAKLDRKSPDVALIELSMTSPSTSWGSSPGAELTITPAHVRFRVEATPATPKGRVSNIKIYQNGLLVKNWRGRMSGSSTGVVSEEFDLPMTAGPNHISAVAFNEDSVQSQEKVWDLPDSKILAMHPRSTLFVLAVGVSTYQDQRYNLPFPASDALLVASAFDRAPNAWDAEEQRLMDWNQSRSILDGDTLLDDVPHRTVIRILPNEKATKESILSAIRDLVALAKPEDSIILYFSGHGVTADHHFYYLPYDSAIHADPQKDIPPLEVTKASGTLLSDQDLETALQDLNVAHAALILDACQSGKALSGSELRGPRLYSGFGRLAYEKGIYLLAAASASEAAIELPELNHSVLTYALVSEGLLEFKADTEAVGGMGDGTVDLRKWLSYATERVAPLIAKTLAERKGPTPRVEQHPRFSPREIPESSRLVLSVADKQP